MSSENSKNERLYKKKFKKNELNNKSAKNNYTLINSKKII